MRYSEMATPTITRTLRSTARAVVVTGGGGGDWEAGVSSGAATAPLFQPRERIPALDGTDEGASQTGDAGESRARVRADHGADLRDELRRAAEERRPALGEALRRLRRADV